jgi:hypothetical protein
LVGLGYELVDVLDGCEVGAKEGAELEGLCCCWKAVCGWEARRALRRGVLILLKQEEADGGLRRGSREAT